ncbi:MAG TPA: conjugal transfer protein TraF [Candidatus Accumulibacter phosphatis]|nr:conjugal transfer protein TraF [Accumulibacter sp.]HRQ97210.1 conjugal transfer protein TraF [Candidatus Accumulibacter phosphatis]
MWILLVIVLSCLAPAALATGRLEYPSVWVCDEDRFQWYCDRPSEAPPDPAAEKPPASEEDEAVAALKALREDLERKRALAIVQPTPANLRRYIAAQEALMDRAALFSDVWRRVLWAHPELNYQLRNPVNNAAIQVRDAQQAGRERAALAGLGRDWGLFFFFRSDCPYCHRLAPTLKWLSEQLGLTVFPVSLDGGGLPEFPRPARDNGMAARLGLRSVPLLVLGNIHDRRLLPIGSGVLSAQEIVERIYLLTQTRPGEPY